MNHPALKDLLYHLADDLLILGHRNAEWTGLGPILEEDIAFASMAQDKVGQSWALYKLLHDLGEPDPDQVAFRREAGAFRCCHLVELPIGAYEFSLMRHFLFDTALLLRFRALQSSSYVPLAQLARKFTGEVKYHDLHGRTWIKQLGNATVAARTRLQAALDEALPWALGVFEAPPREAEIIGEGLFTGEALLQAAWEERVRDILQKTQLALPDFSTITPAYGGRAGRHTEHLAPLLDEMSEVFRIEPDGEW
ncbi:MAG: 1,2-phenylacetyl-CoA epoxidase subunit PaaC [Catalinimonas sp.]